MTPDQEERRGEEARVVLENPIYKESYAQIEANIVARLALQATTATEAEELRRLMIALRKVRTYMEQVLTTGTMAVLEEQRKQNFAQRIFDRYSLRA